VGSSDAVERCQSFGVARHLKTANDLFDSKPSPKTESLVAAAVQWTAQTLLPLLGTLPQI
jgi:hypothetical protein